MNELARDYSQTLFNLNQAFFRDYPAEASRTLEEQNPEAAVELLGGQPVGIIAALLEKLTPGAAEQIVLRLPVEVNASLFDILSIRTAVTVLSRIRPESRQRLLEQLNVPTREELRRLLDYPSECVGRKMNPRVAVFPEAVTVEAAVTRLKNEDMTGNSRLYLVDDDMRLKSRVAAHRLLFAEPDAPLSSLSSPVPLIVNDFDPIDEVMDKLEESKSESLPVVNADFNVVGTIEGIDLIDAVRNDMALNIQTMVGASREERALSTGLFAVRKRLPWLQVNLLTAFLAAFVVSMFEATIAQVTALAVLMPIAAGQSGNTGAQALAVTMRGLSLREIAVRDWFRMLRKEFVSGLLNGIGVGAVCSIAVYFWSSSPGLAVVIGVAMVSSMTIAAMAGAIVPIMLQRLGQDPAQSSSIVLTTITDITGFISFLGMATLMASQL